MRTEEIRYKLKKLNRKNKSGEIEYDETERRYRLNEEILKKERLNKESLKMRDWKRKESKGMMKEETERW